MTEIDLIKKYEGCKLQAYLCPAKIPTIGYGATFYADGTKVKIGDTITQKQADELLTIIVKKFADGVDKLVKTNITANMRASLISLAYNIGIGNFSDSTVLKKVNINPNDTTIANNFRAWNKGGGKVLTGLENRREEEAQNFFK